VDKNLSEIRRATTTLGHLAQLNAEHHEVTGEKDQLDEDALSPASKNKPCTEELLQGFGEQTFEDLQTFLQEVDSSHLTQVPPCTITEVIKKFFSNKNTIPEIKVEKLPKHKLEALSLEELKSLLGDVRKRNIFLREQVLLTFMKTLYLSEARDQAKQLIAPISALIEQFKPSRRLVHHFIMTLASVCYAGYKSIAIAATEEDFVEIKMKDLFTRLVDASKQNASDSTIFLKLCLEILIPEIMCANKIMAIIKNIEASLLTQCQTHIALLKTNISDKEKQLGSRFISALRNLNFWDSNAVDLTGALRMITVLEQKNKSLAEQLKTCSSADLKKQNEPLSKL
jgi:hypothetical protein